MSFRLKNSRGMTLVSVLVASALIGALALILTTLFGTMGSYMNRAATQTDIDQVVSYIDGILSDRTLCDYALRGPGGALITWDYSTTPLQSVERIEVDPDGPGSETPTIAVQASQVFSSYLKLVSMNLREPDPTKGEGAPVRATIVKSGGNYTSISARLVLNFEVHKNMMGGALRERSISLTLGLDSSNVIRICAPREDAAMKQLTCDSSNSTACSTPAPAYCHALYYVSSFISAGQPVCSCKWICPKSVKIYP